MADPAQATAQSLPLTNFATGPSLWADLAASGRFQEWAKRAMDVTLGSVILVLVAPIILACALAIKLTEGGPAFFVQERTGQGGKRFKVFKLTTMRKNADAMKERLRHLSTRSYPDFKVPTDKDPRITRIGRILRKTSLDELPQIVNVLLGNMSLVGPRPTSCSASTYKLWQTAILTAKPGITGLAQISGRSNIDFDDRIRYDIAYVRNRSLGLDLKILVRTFFYVLTMQGAE